jgi:hypothetical protein
MEGKELNIVLRAAIAVEDRTEKSFVVSCDS